VTISAQANPASQPGQSARSRRLGNRLLGSACLILLVGTGYSALDMFHRNHALLINATDSLPNWAFYMTRTTAIKRGDYVSFAPPRHPLVLSHFGAKPPMFAKIVYGMPGDFVSRIGTKVMINGKVIGHTKPLSKRGEPLVPGTTGIIPEGCYYAGTPAKDGFDSRYAAIGFVCTRQIFGTGVPIL
jgi:conjugal transfer pilin signal peptidase TrbI